MVTIKEIARECGLSVTAVSKALRDAPDISEQTTVRVKQVAKKMGYLRNAAAHALKTKRSHMLGVLFIDNVNAGLVHEYFSQILNNFKNEAEKRGYGITFIANNIGGVKMSFYDYARSQCCDGVVVANAEFDSPQVLELVRGALPIVTIDYVYNNQSAIISDNARDMYNLVDYICRQGHSRIAYIHGELTAVSKIRLAAFYRACDEHNITVSNNNVKAARFHDPISSEVATRELLAQRERPTCIIYPDDFSFIGGRNEIERQGLSIPDDISVVGYDGILMSQVIKPKLTTLKQDSAAIGAKAAELLIAAVEMPRTYIPKTVLIGGSLLEGETVKKLTVNAQ